MSINDVIPCHIFNSLAKPYLEALDDMIDEEEGELEEDDIKKKQDKRIKKNKSMMTSTES